MLIEPDFGVAALAMLPQWHGAVAIGALAPVPILGGLHGTGHIVGAEKNFQVQWAGPLVFADGRFGRAAHVGIVAIGSFNSHHWPIPPWYCVL